MANTREIQSRIRSIQDTMKITNAMYMISSTKLKRARVVLDNTEPYFYTMQSAMTRILRHFPEVEHPFFEIENNKKDDADKSIGYIVVTADKGMAGSYNHNVIKLAQQRLDQEVNSKLFVIGQLGMQYFKKSGTFVDTHFHYTAQDPTMNRARNIAEQMIERYLDKSLDEIYIIYTRMVSSMEAVAEIQQLLPLNKQDFNVHENYADVKTEQIAMHPSPEQLIDSIGRNYIGGFVYGALVESYASEQNFRVMAMEAATDNAKEMLRELSIAYNRARQAAITQEITEIVSGAKAQKAKKKT